jgi:hypothetical protein
LRNVGQLGCDFRLSGGIEYFRYLSVVTGTFLVHPCHILYVPKDDDIMSLVFPSVIDMLNFDKEVYYILYNCYVKKVWDGKDLLWNSSVRKYYY